MHETTPGGEKSVNPRRVSSLTDAERRLAAQIAAQESWGRTDDRSARTAPARAAHMKKFLEQAGGDPVKAAHLYKAHMTRLAFKSAVARRRARENATTAEKAEAELDALGGGLDGAA